MKFYCLHHTPAVDRKKYMIDIFTKQDIIPEWIEDFLPSSPEVLNYPAIQCQHAAHNNQLNNAEISLCLKHNLALKKILESNDYGIIFEDDIKEPSWHIKSYLSNIIKEFESINGDILWIGSHYNHSSDQSDRIIIENGPHTKSRFSHCYMIHAKIVKKIINFYSDIKAPPDWQWNYTIDFFALKSCWLYPSIYQRTEIKEIPSLLR